MGSQILPDECLDIIFGHLLASPVLVSRVSRKCYGRIKKAIAAKLCETVKRVYWGAKCPGLCLYAKYDQFMIVSNYNSNGVVTMSLPDGVVSVGCCVETVIVCNRLVILEEKRYIQEGRLVVRSYMDCPKLVVVVAFEILGELLVNF